MTNDMYEPACRQLREASTALNLLVEELPATCLEEDDVEFSVHVAELHSQVIGLLSVIRSVRSHLLETAEERDARKSAITKRFFDIMHSRSSDSLE